VERKVRCHNVEWDGCGNPLDAMWRGRLRTREFSKKSYSSGVASAVVAAAGRLRALPSGDGLRQSGIVCFVLDAALEGPLFHGHVGCKSRPRESGTFVVSVCGTSGTRALPVFS
jgi:hypothetical protein